MIRDSTRVKVKKIDEKKGEKHSKEIRTSYLAA